MYEHKPKLDRGFYSRDTLTVARELLGKIEKGYLIYLGRERKIEVKGKEIMLGPVLKMLFSFSLET